MNSNKEYLDKRQVMDVVEYYKNVPTGLTKAQTMERLDIDIDGLPHVPGFSPDPPEGYIHRSVLLAAEQRFENVLKRSRVAKVIRRSVKDGKHSMELMRVDGVVWDIMEDGFVVTVS